jgi:drug/metabolite transporter (DMT)-like permease
MASLAENTKGAALMAGSMAGFTLNDACMKALSSELAMFQALFLRGAGTTVLILVLALSFGAFRLKLTRRDWCFAGLRTFGELVAAYCFVTALFHMPLANVSAVLQALPLTVTLAGAVFLGEAVGWRRLIAILVGFCGVLLIVRPGAEGFSVYSFYAMVAVVGVTVRDLATRGIARTVPVLTVAFVASLCLTVFAGLGTATEPWVTPSARAIWLISGATIFIFVGYLCSILVMRWGDISFVAPFRYTSLLWALVLGFLVFGDWPSGLTMIGATIVVATGLFTFWRERVLERGSASQSQRAV